MKKVCSLSLIVLVLSQTLAFALALNHWHWRNPLPNSHFWRGAAYGAEQFVLVGHEGAIMTSPDGRTWTPRKSGAAIDLFAVAYGGGKFVAVGGDVQKAQYLILVSDNGRDWRISAEGFGHLFGVAYGRDKFVAVGTQILVSSDGASWESRGNSGNSYFNGISFGNGQFAAVLYWGGTAVSADGMNWTTHAAPEGIICGVAAGKSGYVSIGTGHIRTSTDAAHWETHSFADQQYHYGIAEGPNHFVVCGRAPDNTQLLLSSSDGRSWARQAAPGREPLFAIVYGRTNYVAAGAAGEVLISADGLSWERVTQGSQINISDAARNQSTMVAVGSGILVSNNGEDWSTPEVPSSASLRSVAHGAGRFVAVGASGSILSSASGQEWRRENSGVTNDLWSIAFGGRFVAVGKPGLILSSPDGANWTRHEVSGSIYHVLAGDGMYVAGGIDSPVWFSNNGLDWRSVGNFGLFGGAYGNGRFVAITAWSIRVSTNGTDWTLASDAPLLRHVFFGQGRFLGVGRDQRQLYSSTDGVTWTEVGTVPATSVAAGLFGNNSVFVFGYGGQIIESAPLAPVITLLKTSDGLALSVAGSPGETVRIQCATDLTSWIDWAELELDAEGRGSIRAELHGARCFFRCAP